MDEQRESVVGLTLNGLSDSEVGYRLVGLPYPQVSTEVWQRVGPLLEDAMQRGESALLENHLFCIYRSGYAEETYLTFRYNPADAAKGGGAIVMVEETTDQVIGARRAAALRDVRNAGAQAQTVEDACDDTLKALSHHSTEIPFALLYERRANQRQARLVATAALPAGTAASPKVLALDSVTGPMSWNVGTAIETNRTVVVDELLTLFEPLPAGNWPLAPRCAAIVPLSTHAPDQPDAALILGVSARRQLDTSYLEFVEDIGKSVAAIIRAAHNREEAARDAVSLAAAALAQTENRARTRVLQARVDGVLEERTRLAREIHDTLLQHVTGIALQLRAALPHVQTSPHDALTTLKRVADLAENTSREARQVVWDMRPNVIDEHEFVQAVEITARRVLGGSTLALHFTMSGRARRVQEEAQRVVLRIVQEAMANVIRHATAKTIRLTLSFGARKLRVVAADDGRGFIVPSDFRSYVGHWGLVGMQERAEQIGGLLRVKSAPNRGTTVTLELPFPAVRSKRLLATRERGEPAIA